MPRHSCPSTNRVAPAGYASVNFRDWNDSITDFGRWQKKPWEQRLHERQSSTSSIAYGTFIATLGVTAQVAHCRSQWMKGDEPCSVEADCNRLALYRRSILGSTDPGLVNIAHPADFCYRASQPE